MYLVLCESNDLAALWVYEELRKRRIAQIELITSEMLSYSLTWEHRLSDNFSYTRIKLSDGRIIVSESKKDSSDIIDGVLNRLVMVHTNHLWNASPKDREYAIQELNSFFSSWLYAIESPMLNRPTPYGLSGRWRSISEWLWLAGKSGLPTPEYIESARDFHNESEFRDRLLLSTGFNQASLWYGNISDGYKTQDPDVIDYFVISDVVVPSIRNKNGQPNQEILESTFHDGFVNLAQISETQLLGIRMKKDRKGNWVFVDATPMPDLRFGGEKLLDAMESTFTNPGVTNISQ